MGTAGCWCYCCVNKSRRTTAVFRLVGGNEATHTTQHSTTHTKKDKEQTSTGESREEKSMCAEERRSENNPPVLCSSSAVLVRFQVLTKGSHSEPLCLPRRFLEIYFLVKGLSTA
ncbi:unnamed protein product, partial [Ectocarpus sp. 12 AP-2014]